MTRRNEVRRGCDAIPNLAVACHCSGECDERPTREGYRALERAIIALESSLDFTMGSVEAARGNEEIEAAVDLLEVHRDLECEACDHCTEFTSYRCEICGGLAGERHALAQVFPPTNFNPDPELGIGEDGRPEPIYYSACVDCLMYVANGELPEDGDA